MLLREAVKTKTIGLVPAQEFVCEFEVQVQITAVVEADRRHPVCIRAAVVRVRLVLVVRQWQVDIEPHPTRPKCVPHFPEPIELPLKLFTPARTACQLFVGGNK